MIYSASCMYRWIVGACDNLIRMRFSIACTCVFACRCVCACLSVLSVVCCSCALTCLFTNIYCMQLVLTMNQDHSLSHLQQMKRWPVQTFPLSKMTHSREANTSMWIFYHRRYSWLLEAEPLLPLRMTTQVDSCSWFICFCSKDI